jgi:arylsulfatase A-like enzyme
VLLITADHWPASFLGVADHPAVQTPTFDQLARNGVRFTRAYTECPICVPARRTLMTGTPSRTHGDRVFKTQEPMPDLPTLASTFRDAGYQAYAVGKLHVYPQRDRIGFDDVILGEEGRPQLGAVDDYEIFLADRGHAGQGFTHGMCNNEYWCRPWHLPEALHITNWTTQQMARLIKRRDPTRPAFWYLSYCHPHPPLVPLSSYLDLYRDIEIDHPYVGEWAQDGEALPYALKTIRGHWGALHGQQIVAARRAFYALCTHIDHQLRVVIGTLREEGLLDDTVILFTSDHGDMLGNHGLWAKRVFYENAANVPMILVGAAGDERVGHHRVDDRLVGWQDVMPTLLDLAGIQIPDTVEGLSTVGTERREWLYGECNEGPLATRMVHDGRFKLIYYPTGHRFQLFDVLDDPQELHDLSESPEHSQLRVRLTKLLKSELYGDDKAWLKDGELMGLPDRVYEAMPNRGLSGQRGIHWPPPPLDLSGQVVGAPEK